MEMSMVGGERGKLGVGRKGSRGGLVIREEVNLPNRDLTAQTDQTRTTQGITQPTRLQHQAQPYSNTNSCTPNLPLQPAQPPI